MISDPAVEAAAKAINRLHGLPMPPWDVLAKSSDRANRNRVERDRDYARAAIVAATPYLIDALLNAGWQEPEKPYISERSEP